MIKVKGKIFAVMTASLLGISSLAFGVTTIVHQQQININGKVAVPSCILDEFNGSGVPTGNLLIELSDVAISSIQRGSIASTSLKTEHFTVEHCNADAILSMMFSPSGTSTITADARAFKNDDHSGAHGIGIAIKENDGASIINPNVPYNLGQVKHDATTAAGQSYAFKVGYYGYGDEIFTGGNVSTNIVMSVEES